MSPLNRRCFLVSASLTAGALLLGYEARAEDASAAHAFNAFLSIAPDSSVDVLLGVTEMGQGASTGMAMILADELGASWEKVKVRFGLSGKDAYRQAGMKEQMTGGSTSVRNFHDSLRDAAASTRMLLVAAAANRWGVSPDQCITADCQVRHTASGLAVDFGALLAEAAAAPLPQHAPWREAGGGQVVGRSELRFDIPPKVDGSAMFALDVKVDGMVYASVRHAPVFGAQLVDPGRASVQGRRGLIAVVELPGAVAVVADRSWRALSAAAALQPRFGPTPNDAVDDEAIRTILTAGFDHLQIGEEAGDVEQRFAEAAKVVEADYEAPYLAHAPMEPMNCTVWIHDGVCELWAPTQSQDKTIEAAAQLTGFAPDRVVLHPVFLGGGFGRRFETDFVEEAVRIALAVKRPVKLIWPREQDIRSAFYRPRALVRMRGALGKDGLPTAWTADLVSQSYVERMQGRHFPNGYEPFLIQGLSQAPYAVGAHRVRAAIAHAHVPAGSWRSTGHSSNTFFLETFLDEMAHAAGRDPYQLRRDLLAHDPAAVRVLDVAASDWSSPLPAGQARGIAFCDGYGSKTAMVAELSLEAGQPKVHRIVCVFDPIQAINPDSIEAQIQGGIIFGLSAALYGRITIKNGSVVEQNFTDYRVVGMADMPQILVKVLPSGGRPGGVGEAGVPCVAPALANAMLALTGKPVRRLPLIRA